MAVSEHREPEPDSLNASRTGDEMGAVFAQQKKCPLNTVVRAAGFFAAGEKEGKRDTSRGLCIKLDWWKKELKYHQSRQETQSNTPLLASFLTQSGGVLDFFIRLMFYIKASSNV